MLKLAALFCLVAIASGGIAPLSIKEDRIVGGEYTTIEEHPFQVSLQYNGNHICGGSIISEKYVLTAAHCSQYRIKYYKIRAGSSYRQKGGTLYQLANIIVHPQYDEETVDYDFALIEIAGTFSLGDTMAAATLPEQNVNVSVPAVGTTATVSGWGSLIETGSLPYMLMDVDIPIVSQEDCNVAYEGEVTDRMLCAGFMEEGGKNACKGDSGGPLIAEGKLVGLVCAANGCALPGYPGIFSRVAAVRDWIQETAGV